MDPITGSLIAGGASAIGNIIAGNSASKAQKEANKMSGWIWQQQSMQNKQFFDEGNKINIAEAQKGRDFEERLSAITRDYNSAEAEKMRVYNTAEAEKNRLWEEGLSNSAYQRAVADMKKAGINPMLAYMQGGASSPTAGSASGGYASTSTPGAPTAGSTSQSAPAGPRIIPVTARGEYLSRAISSAVNSAIDVYRSSTEKRKVDSEISLNKMSEDVAKNSAWRMSEEARNTRLNNNILELTKDSMIKATNAKNDVDSNEWLMWANKLSAITGNLLGGARDIAIAKSLLNKKEVSKFGEFRP